MKDSMKGSLLVILGTSLWGIMGIFVRGLGERGFTSFDIAFIRCLVAGIGFFVFMFLKEREKLKIDAKGLFRCVMYGIVSYGLGFVAYGISVQYVPVAVATVLMFMSPVWAAILEVVVFKVRLKPATVIIIAVCIFGAALTANLIGVRGERLNLFGILAGLLNGFCIALQIIIPRYYKDAYKKDTMLVYGFIGGAIALAFTANISLIGNALVSPNAQNTLFHLFGIGVLCTLVANVAFVKSTEFLNTTTASILSAMEVVIGAIVGLLYFKEAMTGLQVLGTVIVIGGSLMSSVLEGKEA